MYYENPIKQQFDFQEYQVDKLQDSGIVEFIIPAYMKGYSLDSYVIVCDEVEDVSLSQLRMIGTRVGENSRIFLCGDIKQSVLDKSWNCPLMTMVNKFKGNKIFGYIYLEDIVRSETAKLFADLY